MSDQRLARLMGPLGLVIVVCFVLGFGVLAGNNPGENASGTSVVAYYETHTNAAWAGIWVVGAGLGLMTLYSVMLRAKLREAGAGRFLPTMAFAGGLMFVAGVLASGLVHQALISAAHEHRADVAGILNFIDQNDSVILFFGVSVTALASGVAILNHSSLPKWLGWVALLIGVVCLLGDIGFIGVLAFGVWIVVAGFIIGPHQPTASSSSTAETLRTGQSMTTG